MAGNTNDEVPSNGGEIEKLEAHWGWRIAVGFGIFAVFGAYAAHLIPAFAGLDSNPRNIPTLIFSTGLLGYFYRKSCGLSGGKGWLVGGIIGFLIWFGGIYLKVYSRAQIQPETWQDYVAEMNKQMPLMVNDDVRADRVAWVEDGFQFHLTFIDAAANELDEEYVRREFKEYYVSSICETPDWEAPLAQGVTFTYYVVDKDGGSVADFMITNSDCQ